MDRFHRYYRLHHVLSTRRTPVSRATLQQELECSRATVNRIIDDLRGYGAPIEYLREQNGWRYTPGVAFHFGIPRLGIPRLSTAGACYRGTVRGRAPKAAVDQRERHDGAQFS